MNLHEVSRLLEGSILTESRREDIEIDRAYAVDLLSDVLALTDERTTLITGNISPQVVRVADILNVIAIIFVRGKRPSDSAISYAETLGIPIIWTKKTMFETCGLMYANGVRPCKNRPMAAPEG
ncbi:MAG: transcriptional regulator [Candidatus Bipolaricaulis sp.]|nr:transcriptional regulator [Candidatus Bipolaricaulis sp.]